MLTGTSKSKLNIRREYIEMTDIEIMRRYLNISNVPCKISSPLREDDDTPSFSLTEWNGKVYWKDFGTGESGDIINLMARLWFVSYQEALLKIKLDCGRSIPSNNLVRKYKGKISLTHGSDIQVKVRDWHKWDEEYWAQYGISLNTCKYCDVHPISHAFFTRTEEGNTETLCVPMDKLAYAYFEWKDGIQSIKLYQPYSTKLKWLSKHNKSVWDLWTQAFDWAKNKSNKAVIITSSRKDAMCLWQNLKVPAMSLQGEGYIPKPQVMQQVLDTFKTVYLWYDNDFSHTGDNPGQDNAHKLQEMFPALKNICIPKEYQAKDPSDLVRDYGVWILKEVWKQQK